MKHSTPYSDNAYLQCGSEATFEPFDAHSIFQEEKALATSSHGYLAPVDIGSAGSVELFPLASEVGMHDGLDYGFDSSAVTPFRNDLSHRRWQWPEQHSAHAFTTEMSQGYPAIPTQDYDYFLADFVEAKPEGHAAFHYNELEHRSIPRSSRQRYDTPGYRIDGQETRFVCTVENCGKNFSGEWEKTRHINSMHRPPTIGCRKCNYKQSRKDLFSEHCKKRHPGVSIEELRVQLDVPDA